MQVTCLTCVRSTYRRYAPYWCCHNSSSVFIGSACKVQPGRTFIGLTRKHQVAVQKKGFQLYYAMEVLSPACFSLQLHWGRGSQGWICEKKAGCTSTTRGMYLGHWLKRTLTGVSLWWLHHVDIKFTPVASQPQRPWMVLCSFGRITVWFHALFIHKVFSELRTSNRDPLPGLVPGAFNNLNIKNVDA